VRFYDVEVSPPSPTQRRRRALIKSPRHQRIEAGNPLVTAIVDAFVGLWLHLSRWLTLVWLFDRPASIGCFPQESAVFLGWGGSNRTGTPAAEPPPGIDREPHPIAMSIFRTRLCEANLIAGPI
jgi:hypothetical protein